MGNLKEVPNNHIYGFDHDDIKLLSDEELLTELCNSAQNLDNKEYYKLNDKYYKLKEEALNRMQSSNKVQELELVSRIEKSNRRLEMLREERNHFDNLYQSENKTVYLEIVMTTNKDIEIEAKEIQRLEKELQKLRYE